MCLKINDDDDDDDEPNRHDGLSPAPTCYERGSYGATDVIDFDFDQANQQQF